MSLVLKYRGGKSREISSVIQHILENYADVIVVDRNLFEAKTLDISSTKALKTYVQGILVYETE